jgi:hypothetical protein
VLVFTPDVKEALEWFQLTFSLHGGPGWLEWQRIGLPHAGGVNDQPAKVMEALTLIAREENALVQRARRRAAGTAD